MISINENNTILSVDEVNEFILSLKNMKFGNFEIGPYAIGNEYYLFDGSRVDNIRVKVTVIVRPQFLYDISNTAVMELYVKAVTRNSAEISSLFLTHLFSLFKNIMKDVSPVSTDKTYGDFNLFFRDVNNQKKLQVLKSKLTRIDQLLKKDPIKIFRRDSMPRRRKRV